MSDIYLNFKRAWVRRAVDGPDFAFELAKARSTMQADPAYDPRKHRAALFEARSSRPISPPRARHRLEQCRILLIPM
jgi:hypothetical protein